MQKKNKIHISHKKKKFFAIAFGGRRKEYAKFRWHIKIQKD